MSAAKQHAEWLSLVEVSGPFLTLAVLNQTFKFGLDAHDANVYRAVKDAYAEWEESGATAIHTAWVRFLLTTVLGYPDEVIGEAQAIPESAVAVLELQGERIRPHLAILDPDDPRRVRLPILVYGRTQKLDSPVAGEGWSASPHARMQALLQNTGMQAGFVTNGAQWSLVHVRKGEPTGFATWQMALLTEEKVLLQAFRGILGVERTLGSPAGETLFDLLDKSAEDQEEVTQELGRQVRQAVEVFLNALDRLDQDSGRTLLTGQTADNIYKAALTVMMRLIFLLCAEERGLMDQRELYTQFYSVATLNEQLRAAATLTGEEVLEHRRDSWMRLLATFRLVHGGCNHEDLNLIAYGGSLFDPDRYPFLERSQIDNRVTLHLLDALQFLEIRVPGGGRERRRLSFRALGVEQIGHVYEGLLDHTATRATEPTLVLTGKETEKAKIPLSSLEANREKLGAYLDKEKIKIDGNLDRLLQQQPDVLKVQKLRVACGTDDALFLRALPFLNLIREDSLGHIQIYCAEPVVGLTGKETEEAEVLLSTLEFNREKLGAYLDKEKIKVAGNPDRLLQQQPDMLKVQKLRVACGTDDALFQRTLPFLNLIREDSLEHVQIYPSGSLYMTTGADRRSSGTHYTPVSLTEEMVQYALEPLVYHGPAEGLPRPEWKLRSAKELLNLKICDIAMGSGAFLVQACRYLSDRLVEAWAVASGEAVASGQLLVAGEEVASGQWLVAGSETGSLDSTPLNHLPPISELAPPATSHQPLVTALPATASPATSHQSLATPSPPATSHQPPATPSLATVFLASNPEERLTQARRLIADRCLYGVDKNPMAAEIAKLSLWLVTMHRDRPLTFLDHALKCGDSLVGVSLDELETFSLKKGETRGDLFLPWVPDVVKRVEQLRVEIRDTPSNTPDDVAQRERLHREAEESEEVLRAAANLLLTGAFRDVPSEQWEAMANRLQERPTPAAARQMREDLGRPTFHFPLEFADVFAEGGFHAIIGNPPFVGGQRITGAMGVPYRDYLVRRLARGQRGSADLCAYFFLRAVDLLRKGGYLGYLATNTISQGDTREVGLDQLLTPSEVEASSDTRPVCSLYRAVKSEKWPSRSANLEVAKIWMRSGGWAGDRVLDGYAVPTITAFLDDGSASGKPERLKANEGKSFIGSYVLGMGFVLEPEQAQALIAKDAKNKDVLFPYLNGEDLNSRPDQSPSRWVINFHDWPLGRIGQSLPVSGETMLHIADTIEVNLSKDWRPKAGSRWKQADEERREKWLRIGVVPSDYIGPVAADYPDCLEIAERLVRPEREKIRYNNVTGRDRANKWWKYGRGAGELYSAIVGLPQVLVVPLVSKYLNIEFEVSGLVYSHATGVIASDAYKWLVLTQNTIHEVWARQQGSTLETRLRYTPSDCFETFAFPDLTQSEALTFNTLGEFYHRHRKSVCLVQNYGLTKLYNLFHDPKCKDADIAELRRLHVAMDTAVAAAYGWEEMKLRHDFYGTGKDCRFTLHPDAKAEVLRRLLKLNHARYAEEVAAGLHEKGKGRGKAAKGQKVDPDDETGDALAAPRRNLFDTQLTFGEVE